MNRRRTRPLLLWHRFCQNYLKYSQLKINVLITDLIKIGGAVFTGGGALGEENEPISHMISFTEVRMDC